MRIPVEERSVYTFGVLTSELLSLIQQRDNVSIWGVNPTLHVYNHPR